MKILFSSCLLLFSLSHVQAQSIGVGNPNPDSSAILDISSITKGVLLTRLTTAQRNLIQGPATGLLVYDTDKHALYMFDGYQWLPLAFNLNPLSYPSIPVEDAADLAPNDNWGSSIDIDGNYAIIGAPNDDIELDSNQGSAFIYHRENGVWREQKKLTVNNPGAPHDHFGASVAISGDYAIVGAPDTDLGLIDRGNAYIFLRNGVNWNQVARLRAFDATAGAHFGFAVDIAGDYAVVGAPDADTEGKAYVFFKDSAWITNQPYQAKLSGPNSPGVFVGESFGWCVSIEGNDVMVGDPKLDFITMTDRGYGYVFTRTDTLWPLSGTFFPTGLSSNDQFGNSVAHHGDYCIFGSHRDDVGANSAQGSAYVFYKGSGWIFDQQQQAKLTAPDGLAMDAFGTSVSISGDQIIAGAPNKNSAAFGDAGGAYLFKRNGTLWPLIRNVEDDSPKTSSYFGSITDIDGFNVLISAIGKNNGMGQVQFLHTE